MVQLSAEELELSARLLSSLASVLDLNTGEPELEVEAEAEVPREGIPVKSPSSKEKELAGTPVIFDPFALIFI